MLAIARALLLNPRLLVMDEPTEGLAPVIVQQLENMLVRLGEEGGIDVLMIEQNIGVACAVASDVAIMVNGRINRVMDSSHLAGDRDLQQALLGVGRHAHDETPEPAARTEERDAQEAASALTRVYNSNPKIPTRWSAPCSGSCHRRCCAYRYADHPRSRADQAAFAGPNHPAGQARCSSQARWTPSLTN